MILTFIRSVAFSILYLDNGGRNFIIFMQAQSCKRIWRYYQLILAWAGHHPCPPCVHCSRMHNFLGWRPRDSTFWSTRGLILTRRTISTRTGGPWLISHWRTCWTFPESVYWCGWQNPQVSGRQTWNDFQLRRLKGLGRVSVLIIEHLSYMCKPGLNFWFNLHGSRKTGWSQPGQSSPLEMVGVNVG